MVVKLVDLITNEQQNVMDRIRQRYSNGIPNSYKNSRSLDVVFMFDTTGSMYPYLEKVRQNLMVLTSKISSSISDVNFGVIAYGDHCDANTTYVTKTCELTSDVRAVTNFIVNIEKTNGGDEPEALEDALFESNRLKWRENTNKCIVLVGDAPPHGVMDSFDECTNRIDYRIEATKLSTLGVKIYSVLCNNSYYAERTFKWFADNTNGKFLMLENIDDIVDLIIGVCMKETGLLKAFENELTQNGKITDSKKKLFLMLK